MITLDLKKEYKALYLPSAKKVELINVPPLQFAMIEGAIEPGASPGNSPSFGDAMQAMYGIAYTLKFMSKQRKENPIDYPVMALEAQWWVEEGEFDIKNPSNWCWNTMILQWHDAPSDPICVSSQVPEELVQQFAAALGTEHRSCDVTV